jgi:hypothetical protein
MLISCRFRIHFGSALLCRVMTATAMRVYGELKADVATEAVSVGPAAAARRFSVSVHFAAYHERKLLDAAFHRGDWGGARRVKYDETDQENFDVRLSCLGQPLLTTPLSAQLVLLAELKSNPCRRLSDFAIVLSSCGFDCNKDFVRSRFLLHGISLKIARRKHRGKFLIANVLYTGQYLSFIRNVLNWRRLKFVDESSFESKGANRRECHELMRLVRQAYLRRRAGRSPIAICTCKSRSRGTAQRRSPSRA